MHNLCRFLAGQVAPARVGGAGPGRWRLFFPRPSCLFKAIQLKQWTLLKEEVGLQCDVFLT